VPYAYVDHYRVMDRNTGTADPFELYDALDRVETVLASGNYELVNLSLGPNLPIDDGEVHLWTALIDKYLADGRTLLTIAAGNGGEAEDPDEARIQVPADAVNAVAVGASTLAPDGWSRAPYSAIGPGRSPGRIKPDLLHFGGDAESPYLVYAPDNGTGLARQAGTSFAAPSVLRLASGVRAHLGSRVGPLALKALLIDQSVRPDDADSHQVGWGQIDCSPEDIVICKDGEVRILFQGELLPGKYLRAQVPMPDAPLRGNVTIKATFCYASPIDPQDPGSYTRSGLDITFRPHLNRFGSDQSTVPRSRAFFRKSAFDTEDTLRQDAQKWETVLSAEETLRATSLRKPVFDIHYNARSSGGPVGNASAIPYALIVTVRSKTTPDLYDLVVRSYPGVLVPLTPVISIPVQV
jgi:hypothetical protein